MLFMIFPIQLIFKFNDFNFYSFTTALKPYKFVTKRTYFLQLFDSYGLTLGAPIPFSTDKPFNVVNKSGVDKLFDEIVKVEDVKVEDVKVVEGNKIGGFDFLSDLYYKILTIISYGNLRDKTFVVLISEYMPLNNILFINSSSNKSNKYFEDDLCLYFIKFLI
jgi:hypothetical protein